MPTRPRSLPVTLYALSATTLPHSTSRLCKGDHCGSCFRVFAGPQSHQASLPLRPSTNRASSRETAQDVPENIAIQPHYQSRRHTFGLHLEHILYIRFPIEPADHMPRPTDASSNGASHVAGLNADPPKQNFYPLLHPIPRDIDGPASRTRKHIHGHSGT